MSYSVQSSWLWHSLGYGFGYKDRTGNVVIPPRFEFGCSFRENLAVVEENGRWGALDTRGAWVIHPEYEEAYVAFTEGKLAVRRDGRWGYIDRSGRLLIPHQIEAASYFSEGRAAVKAGGKWGFIDGAGKVVVSLAFDGARAFQEGLAAVNIGGSVKVTRDLGMTEIGFRGGRWGFIDTAGAVVVEPRFREVRPFEDGRALVQDDHGWATIDRTGKVVQRSSGGGDSE